MSQKEKYNQFELKLTAAINELSNISDIPVIKSFIEEINEANSAMVKTERHAFMLAQQGRGPEALSLLSSDEYSGLKKIIC